MKNKLILAAIIILGLFLRIYSLSNNPPGFYSDEASYAYNAYSILTTGKDEHGRMLPLSFEAFGDYKLPVMLYSIVGSFAIFGVSEWSARLPGVIFGVLTIVLIYYLVKELLRFQKKEPENEFIPLVSSFLLAITPAHIFVSRGTWELTPALFFITLGTVLFLKYVRFNRGFYLAFSATSFIASLYSYNSARLFVPLFILTLAILFYKQLFKQTSKRRLFHYSVIIILALILCLPILKSLTSPAVTQRAKYISIFYDKGVDARLFDAIRSDGGQPVKITQALHNKPLFYGMDFAKRYLSHFDLNFLFTIGDTFEIFQIVGIGFLPIVSLVFLFIGAFKLLQQKSLTTFLLFSWLFISPIASSLTIFTPSTSRAMNMVIPLTIFTAYGIYTSYNYAKNKKIQLLIAIIILYSINTIYFFKQYFIVTPKITAEKWNDGIQHTVRYVDSIKNNYDKIIISSSKAPSYIFMAWYMRYSPEQFQKESKVNHTPDENGLNFTSQFGKFYFTKDILSEQLKAKPEENNLYVGFQNEIRNPTQHFYSRNGKLINEIAE
jgi:4-amino-4-deoxy-L-arabinose transferase-like glycosyltransferase